MNERDLRDLLHGGVASPGVWADLGSGEGAFTLVLDSLLGPDGEVWSVDRDRGALARQREAFGRRGTVGRVHILRADFTRRLELPPLDGVVMANSLHFQRDKRPVLELVRSYLKRGGRLVLIEYDSDHGNPWVPHPLSYPSWERLAAGVGLRETRLLHRVPSRHLGAIYSALSYV